MAVSGRSSLPLSILNQLLEDLNMILWLGPSLKCIRFNGKKWGVRCLMKSWNFFGISPSPSLSFYGIKKESCQKKERKCSKYKVVVFIRKQRLPTVSAILNIGWLAPNVSMPPRPFLNGFEMMRFFLGVYFCIFSTFLKYFYLPTFPILCSLNPDYSFIR